MMMRMDMMKLLLMTTILMINLSVCLSRYGMPKDKDSGKDNNNYYYYYDDDVS